jgi:PHD/YefM family antitoxin component YafN of YafNO toxin-antitoxin module
MSKTISTSDESADLATVLAWVTQHQEEIILEAEGTPQAALIPIAEYEEWAARREKERRETLLQQLQHLRAQVRARNQDLTDEEAEALADRFVREVVDEMITEGKITYQGST